MTQKKKIEFFKLSVSYTSPPLGAKILGGKTFKAENWQLNWAVFSKAIEPEIEKTYLNCSIIDIPFTYPRNEYN